MFLKKEKAENSKHALLKKDELPPRIKFGEAKDNGVDKLHPARWLRLPFANPKDYYGQVPVKFDHKYRGLNLEFSGCSNSIADKTILLMQDRRNPVELKHFMGENCAVSSKPMKEIRRKEDEELVTLSDYNWSEPQSIRQVGKTFFNYFINKAKSETNFFVFSQIICVT